MKNKWLTLAAGIIIQIILGGIYAWSTFVPYLTTQYGLSTGQSGLIFGTSILFFTLTMIYAGRFMTRNGAQRTALISAVFFSAGYLVASISNGSFWLLILGIGVLTGCGIGFGYVCPLSANMKWFPDNKGLITGVAVAGFGGGAMILSSVAEHMLQNGINLMSVFRWVGILGGTAIFMAALQMHEPEGYSQQSVNKSAKNKDVVLSTRFLILVTGMVAGTFGGLMVIGNLVPIALSKGLTEMQAVMGVSSFAAGNAIGRLTWGYIHDRISYKSIALSLISMLAMLLTLLSDMNSEVYIAVSALLGFCFGGCFVVYAASIEQQFGEESFPRLYPLCFVGYGLSGLIAPAIGGAISDATGYFAYAILLSIGIISIATLAFTLKMDLFAAAITPNELSEREMAQAKASI